MHFCYSAGITKFTAVVNLEKDMPTLKYLPLFTTRQFSFSAKILALRNCFIHETFQHTETRTHLFIS
jgi:hypothetical protein